MANAGLARIDKDHIRIIWADGRTHEHILAKFWAKNHPAFKRLLIDRKPFCRISLSNDMPDLCLAKAILEFVGKKASTVIESPRIGVLNKKKIIKVLTCYYESLQSKDEHYCRVKIPDQPGGVALGISFDVTSMGIKMSKALPPAKRKQEVKYCSCRLLQECESAVLQMCPKFAD